MWWGCAVQSAKAAYVAAVDFGFELTVGLELMCNARHIFALACRHLFADGHPQLGPGPKGGARVRGLGLGLGPIIVEQLLERVRDIARGSGVGVLLVEQHVDATLAIADRAYVHVRGAITTQGPATELAADPAALARSYLGTGV